MTKYKLLLLRNKHIEFPLQKSRFELFGSGPGEGCASLSNARQRRHARGKIASYLKAPPPKKIRLIS